jgi:hypothetical protein
MTASPERRVHTARSAKRPNATTSWKIVWEVSHSPVSRFGLRSSTASRNFTHGLPSFVVLNVGSVANRPAK